LNATACCKGFNVGINFFSEENHLLFFQFL
jgi:hypothetical protein